MIITLTVIGFILGFVRKDVLFDVRSMTLGRYVFLNVIGILMIILVIYSFIVSIGLGVLSMIAIKIGSITSYQLNSRLNR